MFPVGLPGDPTPPGSPPRLGVAVLTTGMRNAALAALLDSVLAQHGPQPAVVVVGNGCRLPPLPPGVRGIELAVNAGVPGGRNAALAGLRPHVDVVVYLDDDGLLPGRGTVQAIREAFAADPRLGIVGMRIADEAGRTQANHVPRPGRRGILRPGPVTTFLGGGHAVRAAVFDEVGGWADAFFFAHEETDLAWRALDAGWRIDYRPDLVLQHPLVGPARHAVYWRNNARNRVWLARRHLPVALIPPYLAAWILITLARRPPADGLRQWAAGFADGCRTPCGRRQPIRWRTAWRMTCLGRPPVI
jgi:GT2 family glycosyltransferase